MNLSRPLRKRDTTAAFGSSTNVRPCFTTSSQVDFQRTNVGLQLRTLYVPVWFIVVRGRSLYPVFCV